VQGKSGRARRTVIPDSSALVEAGTKYTDYALDVASILKNAGPRCLRIDYLSGRGRLAFFTPDFFVETIGGNHYLVEAKGREDQRTP
jgi:type III restriction enzyme